MDETDGTYIDMWELMHALQRNYFRSSSALGGYEQHDFCHKPSKQLNYVELREMPVRLELLLVQLQHRRRHEVNDMK